MFRSTRANARRINLLASSSFVASTVLAGAGGLALTTFTPSAALAAACVPIAEGTYAAPVATPGGSTETCGPGPASSIGFKTTTKGLNIYMTGDLQVTASGDNGGLSLTSATAGALEVVMFPGANTTGGYIKAKGGDNGINVVSTGGGTVLVTNGVAGHPIPVIVTGAGTGIYAASSGAGSVTITAAANVTGGGKGIVGQSGSGAVNVTINSGVTESQLANQYGAEALTGGAGAATVTMNGVSSGALRASTGTGQAKVVANGNVTDNSGANAVIVVGGTAIFTQSSGAILQNGTGTGVKMTAGAGPGGGVAAANFYSAAGTSITAGSAGDGVHITSTGGILGTAKGTISGDPGVYLYDKSANGITWTQSANVNGVLAGITATEAGASNAAVTLNNGATVTVTNGPGIVVTQTSTPGSHNATVNIAGGASVSATNGNGIEALSNSDATATSNYVTALVSMTGANGSVTADGANGLIGIEAKADDNNSNGLAGSAKVITDTGLAVTVGASGANNDIGVLATTNNTVPTEFANVTLGDTNVINVGAFASTGSVGVAATASGKTGVSVDPASVTGGNGDKIYAFGINAVGVMATAQTGNVTVSFGTGAAGLVSVTDGVNTGSDVGVLAFTGGAGTVNVTMGNTSVTTNDGVGILAHSVDGNVTVNTQANVTGNFGGPGIKAFSTGKGNVLVTDGASAPTAAHIYSNSGGFKPQESGIVAYSGAAGTGSVTVNFHGSIGSLAHPVYNQGIDAQILNSADTKNIIVNAGNINSNKEGIFAEIGQNKSLGTNTPPTPLSYIGLQGNIQITTDSGTSITTNHNDGIDAWNLGGGDVSISLLDGSITSNTSGSAPLSHGTGPVIGLDPHSVYSVITNGLNTSKGQANILIQSNATNIGPGSAILSTTEEGDNFIHLDNSKASNPVISQTGAGDGITAITTGNTLVVSNTIVGVPPLPAGLFGVQVLTDVGTDIEANTDNGIHAEYKGTGVAGAAGHDVVTVTAHGDIGKNAPVGYDGIQAWITGFSPGNVNVTGANINANYRGIYAFTNGSGNITVSTDVGTTINSGYTGNTNTSGTAYGVNTYGQGIRMIQAAANGGKITANVNGNVKTHGYSDAGVYANTQGLADITINQGALSTIDTTGATGNYSHGIVAYNVNNSNGAIFVNANGKIYAYNDGIHVRSNTNDNIQIKDAATNIIKAGGTGISAINTTGTAGGSVIVYSYGTIKSAGNFGIDAEVLSGSNKATVFVYTGTINSVNDGVRAFNKGGGSVTVDSIAATTITSTAGDGVNAQATGGKGSVIVSLLGNVVASGSGVTGVNATAASSGLVNVTTNAVTATGGTTSIGVNAASGSGGVSVQTDGIVNASGDGIDASTGGAGAVLVHSLAAVTGTNGQGIHAVGGLGGATVTSDGTVTGGTFGINATSTGTTVVTANDKVSASKGTGINASGVKTTVTAYNTVTGTGGSGVIATSSGVNQATKVVTYGAVVGTTGDGINASTTGGGKVNVTAHSSVTGKTSGITTSVTGGNGTTNVLALGNVLATAGDGIHSTTTGSGTIVIQNGSTKGSASVTGTGGNGILASSTGGSNVYVYAYGNVSGTGGLGISATTTGTGFIFVRDEYFYSSVSGKTGGILAKTTGSGSVTVEHFGPVSATTSGRAIDAESGTGNVYVFENGAMHGFTDGIFMSTGGAATIYSRSYGSITGVTGAGSAGIDAENAGSGNTRIRNFASMSTLAGADFGIKVGGTTGGINIVNGGAIGASGVGKGVNVAGIQAKTGSASAVYVYNSGAIWVNTGKTKSFGIDAENTGVGTVTVHNTGAIDPATFGIYALGGGNVSVPNSGSIVADEDIFAKTTGAAGTVNVNNTGNLTALGGGGTNGEGIETHAKNGATTVYSNATINAYYAGVGSYASGSGSISITTTGSGPGPVITTSTGDGIYASSNTGNVVVNASVSNGTAKGNAITAHYDGVDARSYGGGNVTVTTTGDITGTYGWGLYGHAYGGNGSVVITANNQAGLLPAGTKNKVYGAVYGIQGLSTGTGYTTITSNAIVVAAGSHDAGISAVGGTGGGLVGKSTGVTVTANASVTDVNGNGIIVNSGNNAVVTIASGATITGLGDSVAALGGTSKTTDAVVDMTAVTGATTTLTNNGTITSKNAAPTSFGDLAVFGKTSGETEVNTGTILGRQWFGGQSAGDAVSITNNGTAAAPALWETTGLTQIGKSTATNTESVTNGANGIIRTANAGVLTTITFGAGTNTLTNAGIIVAGEGSIPGATTAGAEATPAQTVITGTLAFGNSGTIVLGGTTAGSDGKIDSELIASGATISGAGLVDLDANLWSDNQSAAACSGTLTAADCLTVHASAGNEGIRVTDTKAHAFGAFNPGGIVIVVGSSGAGTFHLDSGSTWFNPGGTNQFGGATNVLDKPGLFFYDLAFNAGNELLISAPKAAAFEFASLGGAATDVWYATTQMWFDRQADLRDGIEGRMTGGKPAVWLKAMGDWSRRSHTDTFNLFNKSYTFNVSYDQDTAALIGGVDFLNVTNKDQAWVAGIQGGAVDSNVRFRFSPDRFHLNGTDFGGYASYLSGPLFIDGTVNANFLTLDSSLPGLQTSPNPWTASSHVTSVGGQLEAGYEFPLGAMAFAEPLGSLSYVNTTLGSFPLPGGSVSIGHDDSFRGSLGGRIGATAAYQYYKVKVAIEGRVWDEFSNNAQSILFVSGGPNFPNNDSLKGVFGEVKGEANLFSTVTGFSAFMSGGVKFKSAYTEGTATLGARFQW